MENEIFEELSPEFVEAMANVRRLTRTLGSFHQETMFAMMKAVDLAPSDAREVFDSSLRESGAMPAASGYTKEGRPVFSLESIAEKFDLSGPEILKAVEEILMTCEGPDLPIALIDPSKVYKVQ